jgi:hypothetical protein
MLKGGGVLEEVHSFLAENNFQLIPTNPTAKDHKAIHKVLQRWTESLTRNTPNTSLKNTPPLPH